MDGKGMLVKKWMNRVKTNRVQKMTKNQKKQIEEHFTEHNLEPSLVLGQQIRDLKVLEKTLRNVLCTTDENEQILPDTRHIDTLLKVQKQMQSIYALPVKNLNFYNSKTSVIK